MLKIPDIILIQSDKSRTQLFLNSDLAFVDILYAVSAIVTWKSIGIYVINKSTSLIGNAKFILTISSYLQVTKYE